MKYKELYERERRKHSSPMLSLMLHLKLEQCFTDALAGDREAAAEFQQLIQYAPTQTREAFTAKLEIIRRNGV